MSRFSAEIDGIVSAGRPPLDDHARINANNIDLNAHVAEVLLADGQRAHADRVLLLGQNREADRPPVVILPCAVAVAILQSECLEERSRAARIVGVGWRPGCVPASVAGVTGPKTGTAAPRNTWSTIACRSTACEIALRNSRL